MNPSPEVNPSEQKRITRKNRLILVLLIASFIVPFVLGDLAYRFGWYKGGQTNHGELISPPVAVADLSLTDASQKKLRQALLSVLGG